MPSATTTTTLMSPANRLTAATKTSPKNAASTTEVVTTSARRIRHRPGEGWSQSCSPPVVTDTTLRERPDLGWQM